MPWLDILILAVVAGQGVSGYVWGTKCWLRVAAVVLVMLVALPLAKPLGNEINKAVPGFTDPGFENSILLPVGGAGFSSDRLGPWQEALEVPAGTGPEHIAVYLSQVKGLVQSAYGYILAAIALAGPLLALPGRHTRPSLSGLVLGIAFGGLLALSLLVLLPPVSVPGHGQWLADGLEGSILSRLFMPLLIRGANALAKFFI